MEAGDWLQYDSSCKNLAHRLDSPPEIRAGGGQGEPIRPGCLTGPGLVFISMSPLFCMHHLLHSRGKSVYIFPLKSTVFLTFVIMGT